MVLRPSAPVLMSASPNNAYRRFAWDGFALEVPWDWNLSRHETRGGISRLAMEDDLALRLEMEWSRSRRRPAADQIRRRFDELAAEMRRAEAAVAAVPDLPPGWTAALYSMPDGRRRLNAFCLAGADFIGVFTLHFDRASLREPLRQIRRMASSFSIGSGGISEWEVFDLSFQLNREFYLTGTAFDAGSKLMIFEWRFRRLFIWWFSPADVIAARQPVEQWCARVLNRFKTIRGPIFRPGDRPGELAAQRDWRYPFGRFEDLYRGCQRYQADCRMLADRNILLLTVFQYRQAADLAAPQLNWRL